MFTLKPFYGRLGLVPSLIRYNLTRSCSTLIQEAKEQLRSRGDGAIFLDKNENSGFATVTIDNQKRKNAISGSMMVQLEEVITQLEQWNTGKGVILRAAGDFFCSGADIADKDTLFTGPNYGTLLSTFMHHVLTRFYSLPMVTVTLVRGKALGGGAELTTVTDFRVFTPTAEVCFVQGRMGIVTGWGAGTRLVKLLGAKTALDLLTTCKKLKPEEAVRIGFADKILTDEDLDEKVTIDFLLERTKHDCTVTRAMKELIVGARDLDLHQSLANERKIFSPLWGGPANLDALNRNIKHA